MGEKSRAQRINLFCPSLSKLATIIAWDDQRLDLGSIARTFGIQPATLKLNGHFISRGVDLIASSVTWKSLLSFFSARGLSTGAAGSPAVVVDGKLFKSGAKRAHDDPVELENADSSSHGGVAATANSQSTLLPKKMKLEEKSSGSRNQEGATLSDQEGLGMKRKLWLEAISPLKRSKTDGSYSNLFSKSAAPKFTTCSYRSETVERAGEEEVLVDAACKRTR